jgi:hypothetical protein
LRESDEVVAEGFVGLTFHADYHRAADSVAEDKQIVVPGPPWNVVEPGLAFGYTKPAGEVSEFFDARQQIRNARLRGSLEPILSEFIGAPTLAPVQFGPCGWRQAAPVVEASEWLPFSVLKAH